MSGSTCASPRALRRALQALAQPASMQRRLFPEFSSVGDELARVFATAIRAAELEPQHDSSHDAGHDHARSVCLEIEACFVAHGGAGNADFWDDLDHPRWEELRGLARRALALHGWPTHEPRPHDP